MTQVNKDIANISKEVNKFIEVSPTLNNDVKTEIKVLFPGSVMHLMYMMLV